MSEASNGMLLWQTALEPCNSGSSSNGVGGDIVGCADTLGAGDGCADGERVGHGLGGEDGVPVG